DLDRFKLINDSLGHDAGDALLRVMAARFKSCVREFDTVARLGGDEFVLLLNGQGEPGSMTTRMERILEIVSQPWRSAHGEFEITCSMGIALYPDDGADPNALLKHADSAMYRAKEQGRNNFQFFTSDLNALIKERLDLESNLRRALERAQFSLDYQPRVDLGTGRVLGCEALLRWQLPGRGAVPPSRFVPVAAEAGLIGPIGAWALATACAQARAWESAGLPGLSVSVNVSARQFRGGDLVAVIDGVLRSTGLEPDRLEIELTESMILHDAERMI